MNTYFSTIAQKIESKIIKTKMHYLTNSVGNSFFLTSIAEGEFEKIFKKLNSKKGFGHNNILTHTLKNFSKPISVTLSKVISLSFEVGTFPEILIPVFKKGNSLEFNNFRPISLTSNISRVIEKLYF